MFHFYLPLKFYGDIAAFDFPGNEKIFLFQIHRIGDYA